MVYGSIFNGPGFYPPAYGGYGGYGGFNYAPNLYPSAFLPPYPAVGGSMYPFRPYTGFFPANYPEYHAPETPGGSLPSFISQIGDYFHF